MAPTEGSAEDAARTTSSPAPLDGIRHDDHVEVTNISSTPEAVSQMTLRSPISASKRKALVPKSTSDAEVLHSVKKTKGKKVASMEGIFVLAAEVEKEENKKEKKKTTEVVEKGEDVVVGRPMGSSEQGHEAKDGKRVEVAAASEKDVAPKSAELTSYGSSSPNEVAKSGLKPNKVVMHFERNHSIDEDASSSALLLR